MASFKPESKPDEVDQSQHILFVEGSKGFDREIIEEIFKEYSLISTTITIEQIGGCTNVNSAAEALYSCHPTYYFLIDRDDRTDDEVKKIWERFPDPETKNLLIWKKRELENYFIDPEYLKNYLEKSRWIKKNCNIDTIKEQILKNSQNRLFLDIVKAVIKSQRKKIREEVLEKIPDPKDTECKDLQASKDKLTSLIKDINKLKSNCQLKNDDIIQKFEELVLKYSGNSSGALEYGKGEWLNLISGKEVMRQVFNNCFEITSGMDPDEKCLKIAKDFLQMDKAIQPDDFKKLITIIETRVLNK